MKQQMKVQLPEKLADIPVRRYGNLRKYDIDEKSSEEFVALKVLECFYDIPNDQANNIDASNSNFMVSQINNLLALKPELVQKFELGGVEYGLIPNINAISFGELVDLKSLGEKDYAKLLAILYRPITEKSGDRYLVADYEGYDKVDFNTGKSPENIMSEAPLDALFGVFTFFLTLSKDMTSSILNSTKESLKKTLRKRTQNKALLKSGDGMFQSLSLAETMYTDLLTLTDYRHIRL